MYNYVNEYFYFKYENETEIPARTRNTAVGVCGCSGYLNMVTVTVPSEPVSKAPRVNP
jgi:hypothetical protein